MDSVVVRGNEGAPPLGSGAPSWARGPTALQEQPDDGRKSASQAELSHCRWHQDGGKTNRPKYHIGTGITCGGRSGAIFLAEAFGLGSVENAEVEIELVTHFLLPLQLQ